MVVMMSENKRYRKVMGLIENTGGETFDLTEIEHLLNEQDERIKELEKEVLDLRAEVGRLNSKKQVEKPHWLKYKSSKGYTKKVNQDIRFDGDVE